MSTNGSYSSLFSLGRNRPFPSLYGENKTAVTVDVLEAGWIVAFVTLYFCYLLILPARSANERLFYLVRVTISLFIGLSIMMVTFGQEWEVGYVQSHTAYKAGTGREIVADIGIKLSLTSVNITLKAIEEPMGELSGEKIDYNERFYYTGGQGRLGFGQFAGQLQRDFRAAQYKGVPYPILWIAEFLIFDGEGLRFGRNYRTAGIYCRMCIWIALPVWILTLILFNLVISYGAIMLMLLGLLMTLASLIWAFRRNFLELSILFADGVLRTHFGFHWYLCLIVGLSCIIGGALIYIIDSNNHILLCKIMNIDPFSIYEQENHDQVIDDVSQGNEIEMTNINAPKKIKRTVTIKAKGSKQVSRNFASTHTFDRLPDDYNQMEMEEIYTTDYSENYMDGYQPNGYNGNQQYGIEPSNQDTITQQYQTGNDYTENHQYYNQAMASEQNVDYYQETPNAEQGYGPSMNHYVDGYQQQDYSYQDGENGTLVQNYEAESQQVWTDQQYPEIPQRKY